MAVLTCPHCRLSLEVRDGLRSHECPRCHRQVGSERSIFLADGLPHGLPPRPDAPLGVLAKGPERFGVELERRDGWLRLRLFGELVLAAVERLEKAVWASGREGRLLIDLRNLTFVDSAGMTALVQVQATGDQNGCDVRIIPPPEGSQVRRILDLSGFETRVSVLEEGPSEWRRLPEPLATDPPGLAS